MDDSFEEIATAGSENEDGKKGPNGNRKVGKNVLVKLLLIATVSFIIGGLFTWVIAIAFEELPAVKAYIGRDHYEDILFLVFLLGFVLSLATSSYAFLSKEELSGEVYVKEFEKREQAMWKQALTQPDKSKNSEQEMVPEMTEGQEEAMIAAADKQEAMERNFERDDQVDDLDQVLAASEKDRATSLDEVEPSDELVKLSVNAEKQKLNLMTFLSRGLESVMMSQPKLDAFSKFGVNLYLAGACDALGHSENMTKKEISTILVESVGVLGTTQAQAIKFANSYEEYLMNPKYLEMIECGREAMISQVGGDDQSAKKMESALEGWNKKQSNASDTPSGTIAVMFTDIVGSTDMTQTHGDIAAQEVVRTHNRIVRAALTTYHGREVKHTGDGIMASFANTANGVGAAIYIQQKVAESNAHDPDVPLGVKIGINTGEPIVEDDDLFGTTVQLAARIVDKAGNDEIFVSETVKGICQGKNFLFTNRGTREMKGFKEPVTIFEALWKTDGSQAV